MNTRIITSKGRLDEDGRLIQQTFLVCTECNHWVGNGGKALVCDCACHRPSMVETEKVLNR